MANVQGIMLTADELSTHIRHAIDAHAHHAREPNQAVRRWDGRTPYGVHPVWAALTLLTERVDEELRVRGALALLYHDLLEDTHAELPESCPEAVRELVAGMTFESFAVERKELARRVPEVQLLKLYDKVSNLLDGYWMSPEKRREYVEHTLWLAGAVEARYGDLNVVVIARAVCREGV